jgi:hypothetical protein
MHSHMNVKLTKNSDNRMWVSFVHKHVIMCQIRRDKLDTSSSLLLNKCTVIIALHLWNSNLRRQPGRAEYAEKPNPRTRSQRGTESRLVSRYVQGVIPVKKLEQNKTDTVRIT